MQLPDDPGLWVRCPDNGNARGRPALFLDRDGVVVEEVHFLHRPADVRLSPGMAKAIADANAAHVPVVVVTNQSGIARGLFDWDAVAAVQDEIDARLADEGAHIDAVFACGYLAGGLPPYDRDAHPWRKPGPGMLYAARDRLGLDLSRSTIIGDRISDLEAGFNAGLATGLLVMTGYGRENVGPLEERRVGWGAAGYSVAIDPDPSATAFAAVERS